MNIELYVNLEMYSKSTPRKQKCLLIDNSTEIDFESPFSRNELYYFDSISTIETDVKLANDLMIRLLQLTNCVSFEEVKKNSVNSRPHPFYDILSFWDEKTCGIANILGTDCCQSTNEDLCVMEESFLALNPNHLVVDLYEKLNTVTEIAADNNGIVLFG